MVVLHYSDDDAEHKVDEYLICLLELAGTIVLQYLGTCIEAPQDDDDGEIA